MTEDPKMINSFAQLAGDYWRLLRSYERLIAESSPENHNRLKSNYRNAERKLTTALNDHDIQIVSYEGKEYSPNRAVTVVNGDEFDDNQQLIINQMMEPTGTLGDRVLSMGKAILSKKEGV